MRHRKLLVIIFIVLLIIIAVCVYININITIDYSVKSIYLEEFKNIYVNSINNYNESINYIEEKYKMTEQEATYFINNPDKYALVVLRCHINNRTFFPITSFKFGFDSHMSDVRLLDDYFDDVTLRSLSPKKNRDILVPVILKNPKTFNFDNLEKYTFKIYGRTNFCLFISRSAKYKGLTDVKECDFRSFEEAIDSNVEIMDFLNLYDVNHKLTLTDAQDSFSDTCSIQRLQNKKIYMISNFRDGNTERYGMIFFDENEKLLGGVFLNRLTSIDDFNFVKENKTTLEEICNIDTGTYIFFEDGNPVSYHYFEDGSYLKLLYKKSDKGYIVNKVKFFEQTFDWLSILEGQDYELIKIK